MEPTPIALLVFGQHDVSGKEFLELYNGGQVDCTRPLDIRRYLHDPNGAKRYRCEHWQLGDSDEVQGNLLNQPRTVDAVKAICREVRQAVDEAMFTGKPVKLVPIYCTAGRHRSHGTAYMAEKRVLNTLTHNGTRVFNINTFILTECRSVVDVVGRAEEWARKPWAVIPGDNEFGRAAVSSGPCAEHTWDKIGELRKEMMALPPTKLTLPPPPPPPPRLALPGSGLKRPWSSPASRMRSAKRAPPSSPINRRPEKAEPKVKPRANVVDLGDDVFDDGCSMIMCPWCKGSGTVDFKEMPERASCVTTHKALVAMLKANEIDDRALQQAVLVLQEFGSDGVVCIRGIIVNLLRNLEHIGNKSAFVESACNNFRRQRA